MAGTTAEEPRTSRVGKRPIVIPTGVQANIAKTTVSVKGPKGELSFNLPESVAVSKDGDILKVSSDAPGSSAPRLQGMARAIIANMVQGVATGYEKILELHGTGYRAELKGRALVCSLGFSHPKTLTLPKGVNVDIPKDSKGAVIKISGADKHLVGQTAATVRSFRPPNPYGGKGVRYRGERVREKAGKAG